MTTIVRDRRDLDPPPERTVNWRRIRTPLAGAALAAVVLAALGQTFGAVVAGMLAQEPTAGALGLLAACVLGGALFDTVGRFLWASVIDRAEGRLRDDLLDAALAQPLAALSEQAVGEVLDRVDDDTHEVGALMREQVWAVARTVAALIPMWIVASTTFCPAWFLFPIAGAATYLVMRGKLKVIAERKVIEEMAWTDHAAALEESIAGRDDLRTSLGQPFAISRLAKLSALVHEKLVAVLAVQRLLSLRAGAVLNGLLAGIALAGVAFALNDGISIAALVTLFLVTSAFVGQFSQVAEELPQLQAGLGAILRIRQMFAAPHEPTGGVSPPEDGLDLRFTDLNFSYTTGTFALSEVNLAVPSGQTVAFVGRTGSGKSTLAALISRAVEPPPGTVFLAGIDVLSFDLQHLRAAVGVVTQRTEIVAGTLLENITLFGCEPRERVEAAIAELGLVEWVAGLPDGLDTQLGPGGTSLSAGEEQLLAFARLLVRDVQLVVLDEATARMDPLTESRVVAAADRLLGGRTGILVAHRLSTIQRADLVAVLDHGRVVQSGPRAQLAGLDGPLRDLLIAADFDTTAPQEKAARQGESTGPAHTATATPSRAHLGATRRRGPIPQRLGPESAVSLSRGIGRMLAIRPRWCAFAIGLFLLTSLVGALGALTGLLWGLIVEAVPGGEVSPWLVVLLAISIMIEPVVFAQAIYQYVRWWVEILLRVRMSVLIGQTRQRRLVRTPPGEVVARVMDADRFVRYADRWVDFSNGLLICLITAIVAGTPLAGLVLLAILGVSAAASAIGRPIAGRSAAAASTTRARFGRAVVSVVESARTIKLAGRTPHVRRHLRDVDAGRVDAAVREHRVQAVLDGVPNIMVQAGAVAAWAGLVHNTWGLGVTLLIANAVNGFGYFGRVAGAVITEAPGTRAWQRATTEFAGGGDLTTLPPGIDLPSGAAPVVPALSRIRLSTLRIDDVSAFHDDGTIGVEKLNLEIRRGELVLLLGRVGSGKSSLLAALAGLLEISGSLSWNDEPVLDPELFLRPAQVAYVAQVPRVLSGTFADNVQLGFDRDVQRPIDDARLYSDVAASGGVHSLVGHRGVRLSGGQVQRLALARALAAEPELLLADDVSSALDATTEIELWRSLRARDMTVIGATSKRAALAQADRVVVLDEGRVLAVGAWSQLAGSFSHLSG